jgi:hypothetical protein
MSKADVETFNLQYKKWCDDRLVRLPNVKPFEFFCADQFLKDRKLSDPEISSGQVDRHLDGGVDGFYCFFQNVLLDDNSEPDKRTEGVLELKIFQCNQSHGFQIDPIDKLIMFIDDLLGDKQEKDYLNEYHDKLLKLMRVFQKHFQTLKSVKMPTLDIEFFYITRKDTEPNRSAVNRGIKLQESAGQYYSETLVRPVNFINTAKLWTQYKIPHPTKKSIPVDEQFGTVEGSYVALVKLVDYYEFLKLPSDSLENKKSKPDEQLFDSNVRGYHTKSGVNNRIKRTLENSADEFWLLNNGITILCSNVYMDRKALQIDDPQVVNGLQTSRRIFDYFHAMEEVPQGDNRRILVRAIKTHGETKRTDIIRATNDQNTMPAEAFISMLRIQHQIEEYFEERGLFYDRRKNYYKDLRMPAADIVEVVYLTQAVASIILRKPHDGRGRPRDYFNKKRHQVWGADEGDPDKKKEPFDLPVYFRCAQILRKVDYYLAELDISESTRKDLRCYMALDVAAHIISNAYCPPNMIASANVDRDITKDLLDSSYKRIRKIYEGRGGNDDAAKNKGMTEDLTELLKNELSASKKQRNLYD